MVQLLNPRTGRPVDHHLLAVTVLHDDPAWAGAWDTALLCMGEEEGFKAAEANRLRALFVYREDKDLKLFSFSSALEKEP